MQEKTPKPSKVKVIDNLELRKRLQEFAKHPEMSLTLLALDLGTTTGIARVVLNGGELQSDSLVLTGADLMNAKGLKALKTGGTDVLRHFDPRPLALHGAMNAILQGCPVNTVIFFEDVKFSKSRDQTQLWGSLRGAMWAYQPISLFCSVAVQTLKKFFAGTGSAKKEQMIKRAREVLRVDKDYELTDNEADALALLLWGMDYLAIDASKLELPNAATSNSTS